jgi:hypothetical protein
MDFSVTLRCKAFQEIGLRFIDRYFLRLLAAQGDGTKKYKSKI